MKTPFKTAFLSTFEPPAVFALGRWFCRLMLEDFFDFEIYGEENVPAEGACLLASNHVSFLDPAAAAGGTRRNCYSFARKTLFTDGIYGWLFRRFLTIPVDRDGGNDLAAIKTVLRRLQEGQTVLMFPEGTRSADGELQEPKRGAGMVAALSQAMIVPTRTFGAFEAWNRHQSWPQFFRPMAVVYGRPMAPDEYDPGKSHPRRYEEISRRILARIAAIRKPF